MHDKIWYEPDSCRLLKREWIGDSKEGHTDVVVVFEECDRNVDIPDGYFVIR